MGYKIIKKRFFIVIFFVFTLLNEPAAAGVSGGFAVAIKNDGIYKIDFSAEETKLLQGSDIKSPRISPNANAVAYMQKDTLFVCDLKTKKIKKISDDCLSFDWIKEGEIVYSKQQGGLYTRNISSIQSSLLADKDMLYYNVTGGGNDKIYVHRQKREQRKDGVYVVALDVSCIQKDGTQTILIEGKLSGQEGYEIGYFPNIAGISKERDYLYIWDRTMSASLSADGVGIGIYDLKNNTYTTLYENPLLLNQEKESILENRGNFSQSPFNPMLIAYNAGGGREMHQNKRAGLLNMNTKEFTPFLDQNNVSMTLCFAPDGKSVYFSAAQSIDNGYEQEYGNKNIMDKWYSQSHSIYKTNIATNETIRLTEGFFDFMPVPVGEDLFFIRKLEDNYCLYQIKNGKEKKIAENIQFSQIYYGGYDCQEAIDFYIK